MHLMEEMLMDINLQHYLDTICEVKTMDNELLLMGRVHNLIGPGNKVMDIASVDETDLPKGPFNLRVQISLRNGNNFLMAVGYIFSSSNLLWRISRITVFQDEERRRFFRIPTNATCVLSTGAALLPGEEQGTAQLIDISLVGIKFVSKSKLDLKESIILSDLVLLPKYPPFTFSYRIISCVENTAHRQWVDYIYRGELISDNSIASDLLCKAIFAIESANRKNKLFQ